MAGTITIKILGDASNFSKATQEIEAKVSGLGSVVGKLGGLLAGAFGVSVGVGVFKGVIDEGREAQLVAAQTAAVIKSTGGAANVTAKDIDSLSNSLSKKIGKDDEAIAKGENLLLTFTNIQNRVGQGNDIFNQASVAVENMASALGEDSSTAAIQLGKALNDPIGGVTALRRVGVQLSAQQEDQVKAFMKANNIAGAQKVILGELTKEFGGSAESQATAGKKMSVMWKNLEEAVGLKVLPVLDSFATWLSTSLPAAIDRANEIIATLKKHMDVIEPVLIGVGAAIAVLVVPAFIAWAIAAGSAAVATIAAAAPVIALTVAVAALVAGLVWAYQNCQTFRDIVDETAAVLRDVFAAAFDYVRTVIAIYVDEVKLVARVVKDVVTIVVDLFHGDWKGAWDAFKDIPMAVIDFLRDSLDKLVGFIGGLAKRIAPAAAGMFDGIKEAFRAAINWIIDGWNGLEFKVPEVDTHIPGIGKVGGFTLGVPDIPKLAAGGIVTSPTLAMIGEAGPEAVVPLSRAGGATVNVNITFSGGIIGTANDVARALEPSITEAIIRRGKNHGGVGTYLGVAS